MKKNNNIIKINGRHYDANTGDALSAFGSVTISDIKPVLHNRHSASVKAPRVESNKPLLSNDIRRVAKTVQSHAPQPSKTLMRSALKKPLPTQKHALKSHGTIDSLIRQPKNVVPTKLSINNIDVKRLKHALVIPKSKLISHFNSFLQPSPEEIAQTSLTPAIADVKPHKLEGSTKPDFLQVAIDRATSHQQPAYKPPKSRGAKLAKRIAKITGTTLGVLILVGIVGYQNISSLQIRMASSKAGFAASLPAYRPIGFKLDNISSNTGEVAVKFINPQDIKDSFTLTEKPSNLNSASLRDSFVSVKDKNYQTAVVKGQTVYLYGTNSATWVNGDTWYIINGNGSLSNTQIMKLVTSV